MKKIIRFLMVILMAYSLYAFVFSFIIYAFRNPNAKEKTETFSAPPSPKDRKNKDRVQLLESSEDGVLGRIRLLESAKDNIDIAYFTFRDGKVSRIMLGGILDAADRGVEVRILLDGMSILASLTGEFKEILYGLDSHDQIHFKFYDPVNPLFPFNWNKRLHDKMILVDDHLALIGGRNVADNYYIEDTKWLSFSKDRDVIIFKDDSLDEDHSVIKDMKDYYWQTWDYKYSKPFRRKLTTRGKRKSKQACEKLRLEYAQLKDSLLTDPSESNWQEKTIPVEDITFVHNPVGKINQDPWCLRELLYLSSQAESSIFMQSPYIIPTRRMKSLFNSYDIDLAKTTLLTNSYDSSPNYLSIAAYANHREKMINHKVDLREYHGEGSIHGKTYIFDDHTSVIGSFNLDARSSYINSESMVVISSPEFTKKLKESVQVDLDQGVNVLDHERANGHVSKIKKSIIWGLSKITPILEHLL